jgi:diketogulonate reductase-like aldo/keto reductase|eukprot:SAG25_NODE_558_length_6927_cov_5.344171_11_plen_305_part_00
MGGTSSQAGICSSLGGTAPDKQQEDEVEAAAAQLKQLWLADVSSTHVTTAAGVQMPRLIYGTAWKETRIGPGATAELTRQAICAGFVGIDTACQPKHYHEPGVGDGLRQLFNDGTVSRENLFLQTKFSRNQDPASAPYDMQLPIAERVAQSVQLSLGNLGVEWLDSLVLHSPYTRHVDTMAAWSAMEAEVRAGRVKQLGVSNLRSLQQLTRLYDEATIKPAVVQMRFHDKTGFEREMRVWCKSHDVYFQSFWTLKSSNKELLKRSEMVQLAAKCVPISRESVYVLWPLPQVECGLCVMTHALTN